MLSSAGFRPKTSLELWPEVCSQGFVSDVREIRTPRQIQEMKSTYRTLGESKWKEVIDGVFHRYGRLVFDEGLHEGVVEPGYIGSMEKAMDYIEETLGREITPPFYLKVHKIACQHFPKTEKIGEFRSWEDLVFWHIESEQYKPSQEAEKAFKCSGLGTIEHLTHSTCKIHYTPLSNTVVGAFLRRYIKDLEEEITQVKIRSLRLPTEEAKKVKEDGILLAIARFLQNHDRLHPVRDGAGRMELLLAGKILVENGFHPAILECPYQSGTLGLLEWKNVLKAGLLAWECESKKMHRVRCCREESILLRSKAEIHPTLRRRKKEPEPMA